MILEQVEYARSLGLPFVYLGYWIDGSRKMRYKNRFQPQEHLTSKGWVRTGEKAEARCQKPEGNGR
jgi:arginine-tRNA-protein transferase